MRHTPPRIETVNDIDNYIANFWRALQHAPDEVAETADHPVNECDLTARHIWLVNQGAERVARLDGDPDYYDAQIAGWWVWGISCWIGSGWCSGKGPWMNIDGKIAHVDVDDSTGVSRRRVRLGHQKGVKRQRIHLASNIGVNRRRIDLAAYLSALADRLRYVRVCCGDWSRVVTDGALSHGSTVGVFLDPPYDTDIRAGFIYNSDGAHGHISADVRQWALEHADNPRYRIVLAGYEGEHDMPDTWRVIEWSASSSYQTANSSQENGNAVNRHLERLWLSPNCLSNDIQHRQLDMFALDEMEQYAE
jgi:site-specific DNA-adenine methylase